MKSYSAEILAALSARQLMARDFVWFVARTRDEEPEDVNEGLWSGIGKTTQNVIDPTTGGTQSREFYGAGGLVAISDIPLVANLQVQTIQVSLSQLDGRAQNLVRTYDCKQAIIQVFRGLYDPRTRLLVSPATCRFNGFVDRIEIETPTEGEFGKAELTCLSNTQELTRSNTDTRSHASQLRRNAGDGFFKDAGVVGGWEFWWGQTNGRARSSRPRKRK